MTSAIPETNCKRIVIIGGGFAGIELAQRLNTKLFQIVVLDKYNYHQFQPLFYQVATAGLEPSAISFPLRKIFQKRKNTYFRLTEVKRIRIQNNVVETDIGEIAYDFLIIAAGAKTNYFGMKNIEENALPMKTVGQALALRNRILRNFEHALSEPVETEQQSLMNIVVVGGGASGVEVAGTLAEMRRFVLPKDYPELNFNLLNIFLIEGTDKVLNGMSSKSSLHARDALVKMGVNVILGRHVKDYHDNKVILGDGTSIASHTLIWTSGIIANRFDGIDATVIGRGGRVKVDEYNRVEGTTNIFAIGDVCLQSESKYPNGHPQVAPVAIQQARILAKNLQNDINSKPMRPFRYFNKGSMATIGRNHAVVDIGKIHFSGLFAWLIWMFIHLISIVGVKNRILIFINWSWNYFTYDQSLRLIIKAEENPAEQSRR